MTVTAECTFDGCAESYNQIVKHVGGVAFGFRNTANQELPTRFTCARVPPSANRPHRRSQV